MLSTYNLAIQLKAKRPRVQVRMATGFPILGTDFGPSTIYAEAANVGEKAVTLARHAFVLPDSQQIVTLQPSGVGDVQLPSELPPGKSCRSSVEISTLVAALRGHGYSGKTKLSSVYEDQTGRSYKSKPMPFNIDGWS